MATKAFWSRLLHRRMQFLLDLAVLAGSFWLAYLLRFDFALPEHIQRAFLVQLPLTLLLQFSTLFLTGIYTFVWRYIGLSEVQAFLRASLYSLGPLLLLRLGLSEQFQDWRVPLSVLLMDTALAYGGLLAVRVLRRLAYERGQRLKRGGRVDRRRKPVLLIGAGQAGVMVAREMTRRTDLDIQAIGFVDDDEEKLGSVIHGLRVLGPTREIPRLVRELGVDHVILTIVEASREDLRRIVEICEVASVRVRVVPGLYEVLAGRVEVTRFRDVDIEDLLGRDPVCLEEESLRHLLSAKRVLVTGAGGSIGSELARQILAFGPASLVLVERSEFALFEIEQELKSHRDGSGVVAALVDVRDSRAVGKLFTRFRPDVVVHAAAHKHVPLMEFHVAEAIRNNTLATAELGRVAGRAGCESFVLVSTDKAVRPTSVMGASKRVAEVVVQDLSRQFPETRFVAVRFGNVLGSTGSVVPIFRRQIERGGPVTVTHPSVSRFFMTPAEAAQLVLQAGAIGESGEILILDMGEPVLISELAKDMIRLSGLRPFEDIDITYTGLRPGEKLYEELELSGENIAKTKHPKIFVGKLKAYSRERVDFALRRLAELAERDESTAIRAFLAELIPESRLGTPSRASSEQELETPGA